VALWNDELYDEQAIFTGSATIVDGKPVLVYPGLCTPGRFPGCDTGTVLGLAVPANASDPLYTNWTKSPLNPIVNSAGRDPRLVPARSTAFRARQHCLSLCWAN
jgi:hypothetical protein